jgi:hypothetical protein
VSASAPFRSGVSDAAAPAALNATPEHNGPGGGGGFQLPHWKEFVPGEERRAATARELALRDASRVIEAGGSAAMARPQHAVATRNGEAPARNGEAPARNGEAPTPNGEAHGAAVAAPQAANNRTRATPPPAARAEVYSLQKLGAELEQLRRMFERRQAGSVPLAPPSRAMLSDARLAGIYQRLSGNAIEPSLAAELVAGL